ncbi:N-acetylmuramoyl-L-alanine amidase [Haloferula sargassicola]|uniref:MurNAc-LAA domain-containing protein n=1 Tax=Haloferula sargassicola TaxID=490096 RepID=A0ABP9URJ7_9BACT
MKGPRSSIFLMLLGALVAAVALWKWRTPMARPPSPAPAANTVDPEPAPPGPSPMLSDLAEPPDWSQLDLWQGTARREDFVRLMEKVFTTSSEWREWFMLGADDVLIQTGVPNRPYHLRFAENPAPPPRFWRSATELGPAPDDLPLKGLRVAIDPGHIGGDWAKLEERWFRIGDDAPVAEGDMTLLVAKLLRPMLQDLGAEVTLVRANNEPVTHYRPDSFLGEATESVLQTPTQLAERLFYRTAEIRARAARINNDIRPDLVVCLHFNAEPWGEASHASLVPFNHLHLLVNGAYTSSELALADQRFELTRHILGGSHAEETAVSRRVIEAFTELTDLPPFFYETNSSRAVNIAGDPYLWGRNLLANRIYEAPVIYTEPYVMNSEEDYARIQAGDYEGLRHIAGELRPSIFHEYAHAVALGLERYYRSARPGAG